MAGQEDRGGTFRIPGKKFRREGRRHDKGVGDGPHWEGAGGRDGQNVGAKGKTASGGPQKSPGQQGKNIDLVSINSGISEWGVLATRRFRSGLTVELIKAY